MAKQIKGPDIPLDQMIKHELGKSRYPIRGFQMVVFSKARKINSDYLVIFAETFTL